MEEIRETIQRIMNKAHLEWQLDGEPRRLDSTGVKERAIGSLQNTRPLIAHWLGECQVLITLHKVNPTIHVRAPHVYAHEMLSTDYNWPVIQAAFQRAIGSELTLNFLEPVEN